MRLSNDPALGSAYDCLDRVHFSSGAGLTQTTTVPQTVVTLSLSKGDGLENGHFGPETASFDWLRMLVGKARRKRAPKLKRTRLDTRVFVFMESML